MSLNGTPTTISIKSNGQLILTFPKSIAKIYGIRKGTKVMWSIDKKTGKPVGRVVI